MWKDNLVFYKSKSYPFFVLKYKSIGVHKKPSSRLATYLHDQLYFDRRDKFDPSMGN